jgi:Holliday junction resolvasome RuvABC endonuclease subunit
VNLLALDLSLVSTGFCSDKKMGIIATAEKGPKRLDLISTAISDIVKEEEISVVIIEGYSFASRSGQAFSIGELGGVVRTTLYRMGIPFIEIPPTCRAKFATGKGNASKNEVVSSISAKTGIIFRNPGADDQCDAWILLEMAKTYLGISLIDWPKVNKDALDKVDWSPLPVKGNE